MAGIAFFVGSVVTYFKIRNEAQDRVWTKQEAIAGELPQFMRSVTQSLLYSRDLLAIIDKYRLVSGPELRGELDILVTDMQTGNQAEALTSFEKRLHIDYLTTFVTGLISETKGVDQKHFLRSTEQDMKKLSVEQLKRKAFKKPEKLRFALFLNMVLLLLSIIVFQIFSGFQYMLHF